jgi:enamine deaminase RidA (YjgF/YER057c/UK114 family)
MEDTLSENLSEARQHIQPEGISIPRQPYSPVVRVGKTVYVSGQLPIDKDRNVVGLGDPAQQAEQCWKNIELCLASAGASVGDIVKVVGYFADLADVEYEVAVRRGLFQQDRYPVASIVQAAKVGSVPGTLMEIEVIAMLP